MPNYAYYCPQCGLEWENTHHMQDRLKERCPQCSADAQVDMGRQGRTINVANASMYPFYSKDLNGFPTEVRSARHWNSLCKQHGMVEIDHTISERLPQAEIPDYVKRADTKIKRQAV